jgi:hypothetical protein
MVIGSPESPVDRVKEICSKKGWRLVGGYNTIEGKEECGVVRFYKLKVKGGMIDQRGWRVQGRGSQKSFQDNGKQIDWRRPGASQ